MNKYESVDYSKFGKIILVNSLSPFKNVNCCCVLYRLQKNVAKSIVIIYMDGLMIVVSHNNKEKKPI